jgi:hypothetical protein
MFCENCLLRLEPNKAEKYKLRVVVQAIKSILVLLKRSTTDFPI